MSKNNKAVEHYFSQTPKTQDRLGLLRSTLRGKNFEFLTSTSVFSKQRIDLGTRLLIESMVLPQIGKVLDIGCGYGAVGISVAAFNPNLHVVMTDVNMRAVRLARKNLELNNILNAEVRYGHFYEPVENLTFNCILSNPPVSAGMETVRAIIKQAPKVLAEQATFQMVIRSKIGAKTLPSLFKELFKSYCVLARGSGYRVLMGTM